MVSGSINPGDAGASPPPILAVLFKSASLCNAVTIPTRCKWVQLQRSHYTPLKRKSLLSGASFLFMGSLLVDMSLAGKSVADMCLCLIGLPPTDRAPAYALMVVQPPSIGC